MKQFQKHGRSTLGIAEKADQDSDFRPAYKRNDAGILEYANPMLSLGQTLWRIKGGGPT